MITLTEPTIIPFIISLTYTHYYHSMNLSKGGSTVNPGGRAQSMLSASSPVHHNLEMHEGAGKHIVTTVRRALGDNADTSFLHHDGNGTGVGESKDGNGHANNGNGHNTSHTPNHGQNKAHSLIAESPVIDRDTAKAISALVVEEKVAAGVLPEHELRALEMKNKPKKKPFEFRG